ncbi:MAG: ABC transporter ATP-binding protein [Woeseiaceae bacterium]
MLELADVRLRGDAVDGFDHVFKDGEVSVVLGTNNSGKTDLCRLIAGLHTQATGEINLDGRNLRSLPPQLRPVSLVYQAFVNYPNLTVRENIASPLVARRLSGAEREKKVHELSSMLQISEFLNRLPHELSGGQQQRLAIARALAKDAQVLLLDEPLANLDFKLRESLENELRDLFSDTNTIVIYTSSDPRDAFALGDQILLLKDGTKIQAGTPIDVYRFPNSFAAMELLAEPIINYFESAGNSCALRPEHIQVGKEDVAGIVEFDMLVTAYETNGNESFIHGEVEGRDWVIRRHGMHSVAVGTNIDLFARADDVVHF